MRDISVSCVCARTDDKNGRIVNMSWDKRGKRIPNGRRLDVEILCVWPENKKSLRAPSDVSCVMPSPLLAAAGGR